MELPVTDVAALARLSGLEIAPQYAEGVAIQWASVQLQARLVLQLDLDETIEPAPVWRP